MVFVKAYTVLFITLLCPSALSQTPCSNTAVSFSSPSKGDCLNWDGGDFAYPGDFEGILNEVVVYTCPTSDKRIIVSNGIPDHDVSARRQSKPCEYNWAVSLPLNPTKQDSIIEIPARGIIAMATNGVPAYGAKEAGDSNAVEPDGQIQDAQFWYGHATQNGVWHSHNPYMGEENPDSTTLLGWALDGFAIYGPFESGSADMNSLDSCNGRVVNGVYQYHVLNKDDVDEGESYCNDNNSNTNWNYILGCYHGTTVHTQVVDSTSFNIPSDCKDSSNDSPTDSPVESPVESPVTSPVQSPPTNNGKPNIIVMQPDDMVFFEGWTPPPNTPGKTNTNDFPQVGMPHMETLRLNGAQMMEAYAASPVCGTSRYSTITGRYPSRAASARRKNVDGIPKVDIPMTKLQDWNGVGNDCTEDNVAVALRAAGYRTGMVGKWHLSRIRKSEYNYPSAVGIVEGCGFDFVDALYIENMSDGSYTNGEFSHNMEFITHEAIRFIEDNDNEKPFFLYVNPTVPHSSQAVDAALDQFTCRDTPRGQLTSDLVIKGMTEEYGGSCSLYRQSVKDRAITDKDLGSIWLDDSVGAILQALEDNGVLDNTLFLFQQDHGVLAKGALYEGGNRIAQFIHYPAVIPAGTKYDVPVSTIDIAATLLDYAEVDEPPYVMDGKSWRSDILNIESRNTNSYSRCLFFELDHDRAVRCGCDKYLTIDQQNIDESSTYGTGEKDGYSTDFINLFDLCGGTNAYITTSSDNQESDGSNLESEETTVAADMAKILDCHKDRTSHGDGKPIDFKTCELEVSPTATPVAAPVANPTPVSPPVANPTPVSPPVANPTPVAEPTFTNDCLEGKWTKFLFKIKKNGSVKTQNCDWLAGKKAKKITNICKNKVESNDEFDAPQIACPVTCKTCCNEDEGAKFVLKIKKKGGVKYQTCGWLANKKNPTKVCKKTTSYEGIGPPGEVCPLTCGTC